MPSVGISADYSFHPFYSLPQLVFFRRVANDKLYIRSACRLVDHPNPKRPLQLGGWLHCPRTSFKLDGRHESGLAAFRIGKSIP